MPTVRAPVEGYTGTVGGVRFENGVADVPDDHKTLSYFRSAGYGVDGDPATPQAAEPADPREIGGPTVVGTSLRDAAVDPEPQDFLPPINAGQDNPHGSRVVSPGLHAVGPSPIRPGEVFVDDLERQQAEESDLARRVLIDGEPATTVAADPEVDHGPLGLSDPGSVEAGQRAAAERPADASVATLPPVPGPESLPTTDTRGDSTPKVGRRRRTS